MRWPEIQAVQLVVSLRQRSRSRLFLLVVGCACLGMAAETLLVGVGSTFGTPRVGRWILALDRNDPQVENRLGEIYKDANPSEGLRHLRRATQLSPYRQLYWSDLESACEFVGDQQCVDEANVRLLQLCPLTSYYHLLAVQRLLRGNELDAALEQSRRLLELDPKYAAATWQSLQGVGKPESVYQKVLAESGDIQLKIGYVDFLSGQGDDDTAYQLWKLSLAGSRPFPFATAAPYLDRLIGLGRIEEASRVWRDLGRLGIVAGVDANDEDNLIFNGDFEQPPLAAG
jgi:tetratricopeptide (TPR) repeat protein